MTLIHSIKRGLAAALLILAASVPAIAIDLPVTTVNGKDYYYYDVQPNETLFSLSQRLGISREEIINYNPGLDGGVKSYTRLYFPVESGLSTISAGDHLTTSHVVEKGETLYGVSKKYGISVDRLIALNPSARDGIKSGDKLVILQDDTVAVQPDKTPRSQGGTHTIAKDETLYRIAVNNGITVEQLLAANPNLDAYNYSEGTVLNIPAAGTSVSHTGNVTAVDADLRPVDTAETPADRNRTSDNLSRLRANAVEVSVDDLGGKADNVAAMPIAAHEEPTEEQSDETSADTSAYASTAKDASAPFNIAVMLPFNLDKEKVDKEAENFTEFYRGFLLAAQNLSQSGQKVNIHTYDTRGDLETVKEIMSRDEIAGMDIFVTPASTVELDYIIEQADSDRQFVFNTFAVRNNSYLTNPNVIQANIPHTMMYQRAIDAFMREMEGRTPIFIQRIGATADKEEFTSMLKSQLADKGIEFKEITYDHALKDEDFEVFDTSGSYVIVPLSSSASEFNKLVPQAKRFKDTLKSEKGLALFGYPEWLTFRGDRLENLGALNATIYSRFYYDDTYYPARRVVDAYRQAYGHEINSAVPSQALMGYDVASFIIKSLRNNNGDFHIGITPYEGMQTDFNFSDSNCEGLVNTSVELIKFRDGGFTEHHNI